MAHYGSSWSRVGFIILAFLGGWAIDAWPAPASYTLIDLGNTFPEAIADDDTVVGSAYTPDQQAAILYPTLTLLTPAGGRANGIS